MEFIKKHKAQFIVGVVCLILLLLAFFAVYRMFYPSSSKSVYGDRLENAPEIDNAVIEKIKNEIIDSDLALEVSYETKVVTMKFFIDVKADTKLEEAKQLSEIVLNNQVIGYIGEVHPQVLKNFNITEDVIVAEILLDKIVTNDNMQLQEFKPFTKFQPIVRDFTFLVPNEMEFSTLEKELVLSSGKYCTNVKLKDIYTGNNVAVGYKSLTFELIYEKMDGTFTDEEMQQNVNKLLRSLKYKLGITLKDEI